MSAEVKRFEVYAGSQLLGSVLALSEAHAYLRARVRWSVFTSLREVAL